MDAKSQIHAGGVLAGWVKCPACPNPHLRNRTECPEGLQRFWMGHADASMADLYDKIKEDMKFRRKWAEKAGFGFKLPLVVPNVPKIEEKDEAKKAS